MRKTRRGGPAPKNRRRTRRQQQQHAGGSDIAPRNGHTTAVFTYGRFQPPHAGHASLVRAVNDAAAAVAEGADGYVFASSSRNKNAYMAGKKHTAMVATGTYDSCKANENPLTVEQKIHFLEKMNPYPSLRFIDTTERACPTIFDVIGKLKEAGYTDLIMLVGSDRIRDFKGLLAKEAVEDVEVRGAGDKRNMTGAVTGAVKSLSGTGVRTAAVAGDVEKVARATKIGVMTDEDVMDLINIIRVGLCYSPLA